LQIAATAAPLIERLATARSALSQLRFAEAGYVQARTEGKKPPREPVMVHRQALAAEMSAGAQQYARGWQPAQEPLEALDAALVEVLAPAAVAARVKAADTRFRAAAEQVASALNQSIDTSAQEARRLALHIQRASDRRRQLSFGLDVLCGLATIVAALLLARALRSHDRLVRVHQHFLERRSAELEAFAGRVAHDVRGSLTAMSLTFQQVARLSGDERVVTAAARGRRRLDGVLRLMEGLLAFARAGARAEPGARAEVSALLEEVAAVLQPEALAAGIDLIVHQGARCAVACSQGALTSILMNLVGNALKHMGERPRRRVTLRSCERGPMVRIEVDDTGPGIPANSRTTIFEPYVRSAGANVAGLGLGLATVKRLVDGHGGRVDVDSAPSGGSLFWFELPRAVAETVAPAAEGSVRKGPRAADVFDADRVAERAR
jgi:signal transduction histidine kinase